MASTGDGSVKEPINREPDLEELVQSFITPSQNPSSTSGKLQAYDRNHGPIQHLSASTHTLTIKSDSGLKLPTSSGDPINTAFTIDDLTTKFPQHTVTCALQCAGNRRHEMRARLGDVSGIDWGDGAVMNARWTGPLLREVLAHAGLTPTGKTDAYADLHLQMECNATSVQDDTWYGGSIPLSYALDPGRECLLALKMNGETLPERHGYPLRAITPGIIGARSVKWLDTLVVSDRESRNFYQQHDYKVLPGDVGSKEEAEERGMWEEGKVESMCDVVVNSVVAVPGTDGDTMQRDGQGRVSVRGYALPGGKGGPVEKVLVSVDKGQRWVEARILDEGDENTTHPSNREAKERGKFAWVLWEVDIPAEPGENVSIWSKATDRGGNTMTEVEGSWNLRGVGFNAMEGRKGITIV